MRVSVEFSTLTNQSAFLGWLSAALTRPDIAVVVIDFPDADETTNIGAFAQGAGERKP